MSLYRVKFDNKTIYEIVYCIETGMRDFWFKNK